MKLTQEEKNQRIAKACGWIVTLATRENPVENGSFRLPNYFGDPVNAWTHPDKDGVWIKPPDYFHDLNAMHEAERWLANQTALTTAYWRIVVGEICNDADEPLNFDECTMFLSITATAAQRAEAFGLATKKWEAGQ